MCANGKPRAEVDFRDAKRLANAASLGRNASRKFVLYSDLSNMFGCL